MVLAYFIQTAAETSVKLKSKSNSTHAATEAKNEIDKTKSKIVSTDPHLEQELSNLLFQRSSEFYAKKV